MDLIGNKYGKIEVISEDVNRKYYYICRCSCGKEKSILKYNLADGRTKSCGCVPKRKRKPDIDLSGLKFNFLTVSEYNGDIKKWKCKCDCGNNTFVSASNLKNSQVKSCGCYNPRKRELEGQRFGKLLVLKRASNYKDKTRWLCQCDCGNTPIVNTSNLVKKIKGTKSCGCLINYKNRLKKGEAAFNKVYKMYQDSAKNRNLFFDLDKNDVREITQKTCEYCGSSPNNIAQGKTIYGIYRYNGIDRVDNSLGYIKSNCVPCCIMCNKMKLNLDIDIFKRHVKKISEHLEENENEI